MKPLHQLQLQRLLLHRGGRRSGPGGRSSCRRRLLPRLLLLLVQELLQRLQLHQLLRARVAFTLEFQQVRHHLPRLLHALLHLKVLQQRHLLGGQRPWTGGRGRSRGPARSRAACHPLPLLLLLLVLEGGHQLRVAQRLLL